MADPGVGDVAPDFSLKSTQGEVRLADRLKQGAVLLVFYPGDDTPVCTKQLCNYRDNLAVFAGLGVDVLAVNPQALDSHQRFAAKHSLPFPILADEGGNVCRAYGALNLLGMAKRALVLVGKDGRIRYKQVDWPIFHRKADELRAVIEHLSL